MAPKTIDDLAEVDLMISLGNNIGNKKTLIKKRKRQQGIIGLIKSNPHISIEEIALNLGAGERTIHRDIEELRNIIVHIGPKKGGYWQIIKK